MLTGVTKSHVTDTKLPSFPRLSELMLFKIDFFSHVKLVLKNTTTGVNTVKMVPKKKGSCLPRATGWRKE